MTGNPTPWLILLVVVVATLAIKGYIKIPGFPSRPRRESPSGVLPTGVAGTSLTAHELGVLFAQAKKREAEEELAELFARQAGESLKATFKAPFSPATEPANVAGEDKAGHDQ